MDVTYIGVLQIGGSNRTLQIFLLDLTSRPELSLIKMWMGIHKINIIGGVSIIKQMLEFIIAGRRLRLVYKRSEKVLIFLFLALCSVFSYNRLLGCTPFDYGVNQI